MVTRGSGLSGDPQVNFEELEYPDHVNLRADPYANSLFEKSEAIMSIAGSGEGRGQGDSSGPKKRISMACGRCRKRKIRCSGDSGDGQPCTNCASAKHSPCQFLRVNSCETLYRDGFNYNVEVSRLLGGRSGTNIALTPSPLREASMSRQESPSHRNGAVRTGYDTERLWAQQMEQGHHGMAEFHLPPDTSYNAPYRHVLDEPPRQQDDAYFSLAAVPPTLYAGNPPLSTMTYRPANMINLQARHGAGTYNLMSGPREGAPRIGDERAPRLPAGYVAPRRPLPSSGPSYRGNSASPGYNRTPQPSSESQSSPITIDSDSYARFDVSSLYTPSANIVEVKIEPEDQAAAAQQGPPPQGLQELPYRYADTTQYRHAASNHVAGVVPVPQTLPTHGPIELVHPGQHNTPKNSDDDCQ